MDVARSAVFSIDGKLRHRLDRWWALGSRALVCMSNPSTAGAHDDDATIRNLIALVRALGYPGFTVVNWLPYVATKPADLFAWRDALLKSDVVAYEAIHSLALRIVAQLAPLAPACFVAWGHLVPLVPHTQAMLRVLSCDHRRDLLAFGLNKDGAPKHPAARGVHRLVPGTAPVVWRPASTHWTTELALAAGHD